MPQEPSSVAGFLAATLSATGGPSLVAPSHVHALSVGLMAAARAELDTPKRAAFHIGRVAEGWCPYEVFDGAAVIPVSGLILPHYPWVGDEWATGCDALRVQIDRAFADDGVSGVVLVVNSGGGLVNGVADLADWILTRKVAAGKPIVAVLDDCAYSAAYWIAATADQIAVPRTGGVGSIGVIMVHWDMSGLLANMGVKPTIIQAGSRKSEGHPYGPPSEPVIAEWTAECEDLRRVFAAAVVRGRATAGVVLSIDDVLGTEARLFSLPAGTADAARLGFVDAVAAPDAAFAAFIQHLKE